MNAQHDTTLTFEDMHDATLVSIAINWVDGTLVCVFRTSRKGMNEPQLLASGLTLLSCPRSFPWGKSASVNQITLSDASPGQMLRVEMQSGDVIAAKVERAELR
jgi:hypothetical protein